jgi:anti-sigma regulatory factor (Ser/Thr protein kinase)
MRNEVDALKEEIERLKQHLVDSYKKQIVLALALAEAERHNGVDHARTRH